MNVNQWVWFKMFWWLKNLKLRSLSIRNVDQVTLHDMYSLWHYTMTGKVSYDDFLELHKSFDTILLMHDRRNNKLCGATAYSVIPTTLKRKSKPVSIIRSGPAYVRPEYQRMKILRDFTLYFVAKEWLRHPFMSLYYSVNFINYKGYPGFAGISSEAYPRYNKPTPEMEQKVIDYYVLNILNLHDCYDRERSVIKTKQSIKEEFAIITEESLKNPHIRFYKERNPDFLKGYALVGILEVSWKSVFSKYF